MWKFLSRLQHSHMPGLIHVYVSNETRTCCWFCLQESHLRCIRTWGRRSGRVLAGPRGRHGPHRWYHHEKCDAGRQGSDSKRPAWVVLMRRCPVCQRSQASSVLIQFQKAPSLSVSRALRYLALSLIVNVLIFAWTPLYRVILLINFNAVHLQIIKSERFTLIFNSRKLKHALFPCLEMLQWSLQRSDHVR